MVNKFDVFLSYARSDGSLTAAAISRRLSENGLHVFADASFLPGEPISRSLEQAISDSEIILLLLSRAAAESRWIHHEAAYALRKRASVVPVVLDRAALDSPLGSLHGDRPLIDAEGLSVDATADQVSREVTDKYFPSLYRRNAMRRTLYIASAAIGLLILLTSWWLFKLKGEEQRAKMLATKSEARANAVTQDLRMLGSRTLERVEALDREAEEISKSQFPTAFLWRDGLRESRGAFGPVDARLLPVLQQRKALLKNADSLLHFSPALNDYACKHIWSVISQVGIPKDPAEKYVSNPNDPRMQYAELAGTAAQRTRNVHVGFFLTVAEAKNLVDELRARDPGLTPRINQWGEYLQSCQSSTRDPR